MQPLLDPLNIVLLAAAVFILWRFSSVLGQRTGNEKPGFDPFAKPVPPPRAPDIKAAPVGDMRTEEVRDPVWKGYAAEGSPMAGALETIAKSSTNFTVPGFLEGANMAYEMILEAFAKGDKAALKPLLSKEVYDSFSSVIDQRQKSGQRMVMQFVGVKRSKIEDVKLEGKRAQLAVRFVGEMISATLDSEGNTVEGDPKLIRDVDDRWTFERDITSRDPNWKLIDTSDDNA